MTELPICDRCEVQFLPAFTTARRCVSCERGATVETAQRQNAKDQLDLLAVQFGGATIELLAKLGQAMAEAVPNLDRNEAARVHRGLCEMQKAAQDTLDAMRRIGDRHPAPSN